MKTRHRRLNTICKRGAVWLVASAALTGLQACTVSPAGTLKQSSNAATAPSITTLSANVTSAPVPKPMSTTQTPALQGGSESTVRNGQTTHKLSLSQQFPGEVFYSGPSKVREVALTFDDGPDTKFTPQILAILDKYHIKATFFIIGTRAIAHPDMVRRIAAAGHAIGNHSWNHPDLIKLTDDEVKDQILETDRVLFPLIGYHSDLFRPPYGDANPGVVQDIAALNYKVVNWSVDTRDWAGTPADQILYLTKLETHPGAIILQHCAGGENEDLSNTVAALPKIIEYLKSQGYQFVTVPQLIGIPR